MSGPNFGRYIANAILAGVIGRGASVLKTEVENAKREFQRKLKALGAGAILVAVAMGLAAMSFVLLLIAGLIGLSYIWPLWLVFVVVGGGLLLIGLLILAIGASKIKKNKDLMPQEAIDNIKNIFGK